MSTPTPPSDSESSSPGRGGGHLPPSSPDSSPDVPPPVAPSVGTPAPFGQGDPRFGGGWSGPTPGGSHDDGSRSPHAAQPPKPRRRARTATSILYPKPSRDSVLTAAVAVGIVIVVKFAVAFVQLIGNAIDYSPTSYANGFLASPIGLFLGSLVLYPFFFYLAAFVALALFFPLLRQSSLPTVLGRAVAAGIVATIVLAAVGIVTGIRIGVTTGDWIAVALYVIFIPLSAGIQLTAVLVAGAVVAWLWLGRQGALTAHQAGATGAGAAAGTGVDADVSAGAAAAGDGPGPLPTAPEQSPDSPSTSGDEVSTPAPSNAAPPVTTTPPDPSAAPPTGDPVSDLSRFAPPSTSPITDRPGIPPRDER